MLTLSVKHKVVLGFLPDFNQVFNEIPTSTRMATQRLNRFKVETQMLRSSPPPGITCRIEDDMGKIVAEISGPPGSPFEKGIFVVEITLSDRYPFMPPNAKFVTPIYHPNVDTIGRICLSGLKPKPSGTWSCSMNIATILSAIRLLLSEPNLGDPLMADIATEYKDNYSSYLSKARAKTLEFASPTMEDLGTEAKSPEKLPISVKMTMSPSSLGNKNISETGNTSKVDLLLEDSSDTEDDGDWILGQPRKKYKISF